MNAFKNNARLADQELTNHRCEECDQIRIDFENLEWSSVADSLVEENVDALSLFTAKAYRYYFPSFLLYCLKKFDPYDTVLQFVLLSLCPSSEFDNKAWLNKRKSLFTVEQRGAVIAFLELILSESAMRINHGTASEGLQFWRESVVVPIDNE